MNNADFRKVDEVEINGKTRKVYEHYQAAWYRIGKSQIHAFTKDEAVEKYRRWYEDSRTTAAEPYPIDTNDPVFFE